MYVTEKKQTCNLITWGTMGTVTGRGGFWDRPKYSHWMIPGYNTFASTLILPLAIQVNDSQLKFTVSCISPYMYYCFCTLASILVCEKLKFQSI